MRSKAGWDTGSTDLDEGSFKNGKLVIMARFDRDGQTGVVRVEAALEGGKLVGRWKVLSEDGQEFLNEPWSAVPEKPLGEAKPEKKPAREEL